MIDDPKLVALLKEKYNIVIDEADYLELSLILPVIKTIRKFDAESRYVHESNSDRSKIIAYLDMLWRYGEVDYRFNGTYVKISENEDCDGYTFTLFKQDESGENYIQYFSEDLKAAPYYTLDYIQTLIMKKSAEKSE